MTPAWVLDVLAAVMLVVAAVSAARLVAARPWQHGTVVIDTDVAHLMMGIAMAGMLVASLTTLPDTAWEVIFALLAVWFAVRVALDATANGIRALAGGHCAPHLVHSGAMLYMFLAMGASGAMPGGMGAMPGGAGPAMKTLSYPTLALVFALILVGYSIWDVDQLSGRRYSFGTARVSLAGITAPAIPVLSGAEPRPGTPDRPREAADHRAVSRADDVGGGATGGTGGFLLSPAVTVGCRIAMGVVMAFMLFIAI